jgi:DNA repair exonuclease SbcCD ATPase subunit
MMLGFAKRPKTDAPLTQGDSLKALLAERAQVQATRRQLEANLAMAEARLEVIPAELDELNGENWRGQVKRELDPSLPDRSAELNQRFSALQTEEAELKGKVRAYHGEIAPAQRREDRLRDEIEQAWRAAWAEVGERLLSTFTPEVRQLFLETWVALEAVNPYTKGQTVLERLDLGTLETETRVRVLETLRERFDLPVR